MLSEVMVRIKCTEIVTCFESVHRTFHNDRPVHEEGLERMGHWFAKVVLEMQWVILGDWPVWMWRGPVREIP